MTDVGTPAVERVDAAPLPPERPPQRSHEKTDPWILRVLGSYGVAAVVLVLLAVLTFFGTLEQRTDNIYNVVNKYFKSAVVVVHVGPLPLPLPGAYLLLSILGVNLLVGGLVRLRYSWSRAGILVIHLGMVVLLAGALVEERTSISGKLAFAAAERYHDQNRNGQWDAGEPLDDLDRDGKWTPGETVAEYESYTDFDIVVAAHQDDGSLREFVLPFEQLVSIGRDGQRTFTHADLPFRVTVRGWAENARVARVPPGESYGVGGLALRPLPGDPKQKERDLPGAYVTLADPAGGFRHRAILWAGQRFPHRVKVAGRTFDLDLRPQRWALPFALRLNEVVHEKYPRSGIAKEYSSHVTKIENDLAEDRHITMNEPLRHRHLTFYQSEVRADRRGGPPRQSVLAVVYNPADGYGAWAVGIVAIGLLWHMGRKLYLHIRAEARRRTACA